MGIITQSVVCPVHKELKDANQGLILSAHFFHEALAIKIMISLIIHSILLVKEEHLSVRGGRNVHKILATCLWEAHPRTVKLGQVITLATYMQANIHTVTSVKNSRH